MLAALKPIIYTGFASQQFIYLFILSSPSDHLTRQKDIAMLHWNLIYKLLNQNEFYKTLLTLAWV